ncbi:hypothetical protein Y1Q_0020949 [Alligator mississippiensis]|uniref:Calx-beta domain-containing protein n=1 Tax=Alligator mississippiensis TaxID=8496 RepID=A0A151NJK4_ALLMI|nr:hypothetical protein Y1Q_0020949 [Alligator mississippiensis]
MVPEVLEIKWSRIELAETFQHVCENIGTVAIKVVRTGQSMEPSFVDIRVQDVSARVGLDFTHSTASLVQFDPGVSIKAWNICLKDPGLEENDEVAKIILSAPKNVVLGQKNELTVRIIDSMAVGGCDSSGFSDTLEMLERRSQVSESAQHPGVCLLTVGDGRSIRTKMWLLRGISILVLLLGWMSLRQVTCLTIQTWIFKVLLTGGLPENGEKLQVAERCSRHDLPQRDLGTRNERILLQNSAKQVSKSRKCPFGWTLQGKHCYLLNPVRNATWESAEMACREWSDSLSQRAFPKRNGMALEVCRQTTVLDWPSGKRIAMDLQEGFGLIPASGGNVETRTPDRGGCRTPSTN